MSCEIKIKGKICPQTVKKGDTIAIVSPATTVKDDYVRGAAAYLKSRGYVPVVMPSALGPADGSYAASHEARLQDLMEALENPEATAILCARGGYGCVHLIADPKLIEAVKRNPKWIIGFSDVSALHALWLKAGVMSIHGPMAKHITIESPDDPYTEALLKILSQGSVMDYSVSASPFNRPGKACGELRGGNLAVLNCLASTSFDMLSVGGNEDVILFIEDISEAIYAVERMLTRLYLSGTLSQIKGLIVGQFTEYRPDKNFRSMEEMIDALLIRCGITDIPVAFNFPVGHVSDNLPLVEGATVELDVTPDKVTLKTI